MTKRQLYKLKAKLYGACVFVGTVLGGFIIPECWLLLFITAPVGLSVLFASDAKMCECDPDYQRLVEEEQNEEL